MILICTNELAGTTGYHKAVVELANGLHRLGYPVAVVGFLGDSDGSARMLPTWPLDLDIQAVPLQTLAAEGGRLLHRNYHPVLTGAVASLKYAFTANHLAALRQVNASLSADDTIIFTSPVQALAFQHALGGVAHNPQTILQIHGDYLHFSELWQVLMEARGVIDRLQTVAEGLRAQFIPTFHEQDVVSIPNFHGESGSPVERVEHDGVNVVLPASFQPLKNQLDAVRALSLIDDESVHLTLWGRINKLNPYFVEVDQLVESLGLTDRVHLPGFGSEHDVYSTADVVLMTSRSEGFGYPLIEAAHHGLPTVAYDFEFGPREAIDDGKSGFIVPLGDVAKLAERLTELAADGPLRRTFGERGQEIYAERFSHAAIAEKYRRVLGSSQNAIDLAKVFGGDELEPVGMAEIRHRLRHVGGRPVHQVTVASRVQLHDIEIDNGERVVAPKVQHTSAATLIEFHAEGDEVISYVTAPGSTDRHYLANTAGAELEVLPYLRRDATYGDGTPPVADAVFAASDGEKRLTVGAVSRGFSSLALNAPRHVAWKIRQGADPATPAAPVAEQQTAPPAPSESRPSGQASKTPSPSALGRLAASLGNVTIASGMRAAGRERATPTRREIGRHPRFPVTSGVDNFGLPINQPGGVVVRNAGTVRRPIISIKGEYDSLTLRDGAGQHRIAPPFSYGEMFERICTAERDHGLFDIATADGVHLWELGRSALIVQLAEALGMWGSAPAIGTPVADVYNGSKRLTAAPPARRVVFDYARRGGSDYRTAAFRDESTMFVVQPEPDGYPEVDEHNLVYPLHEFNEWRKSPRRRWTQSRTPDVDPRPFDQALGDALGIRVDVGSHLRTRLANFIDQRDFWTPVFERVQPEEVLIVSSHWWSGVSAAAQRAGALVSDIQYAETGKHHPTFWFGGQPRHGATRLYAWSELWAERTNVHQEHVIVPRQQPEFSEAASRSDVAAPIWDICVISQPRVLRRILAYLQCVVRARPGLRIVIAPHPAQRQVMARELAAAGLTGKVSISAEDTLTTVQRAEVCVGGYSTSIWEAAALGRPVYVIPVPGHELTLPDIESGLFRLAASPDDLVPFEVPEIRHAIFGPA